MTDVEIPINNLKPTRFNTITKRKGFKAGRQTGRQEARTEGSKEEKRQGSIRKVGRQAGPFMPSVSH